MYDSAQADNPAMLLFLFQKSNLWPFYKNLARKGNIQQRG